MKRRHILAGWAAMTLAAPAVRAAVDPKPLKFIPQADTALLDPSFAPALVTRNHAYMVYDTLTCCMAWTMQSARGRRWRPGM